MRYDVGKILILFCPELALNFHGVRFTHVHGFEVVEDALVLMDDFDGEVLRFVGRPAEFVTRFDVETPAEIRRDRDHPSVADLRFLWPLITCQACTYRLTHHTC